MPPPPHYRVTWSGTLGPAAAPLEIWSCSLAIANTAAPFLVRGDLPPFAASLYNAFAQFGASNCHNSVTLRRCRIASVSPTVGGRLLVNKDSSGAFVQADRNEISTFQTSAPVAPSQVALAITLQSAASGATGRGRFYVPMPVFGPLGVDLVMAAARAAQFAASAKQLIEACNAASAALGQGKVVVASGGSPTKGIAPALRPVTSVKVGRVLDTIRTRRNALVEEPSLAAIA